MTVARSEVNNSRRHQLEAWNEEANCLKEQLKAAKLEHLNKIDSGSNMWCV